MSLCIEGGTGWSRGAVEADGFFEIMISFGGFGVDCKLFVASLVAANNVVVMILSCAVIHISN